MTIYHAPSFIWNIFKRITFSSFRITWAVFPWTIVVLSWIPVLKRFNMLKVFAISNFKFRRLIIFLQEHFQTRNVNEIIQDSTTIMCGRGWTYYLVKSFVVVQFIFRFFIFKAWTFICQFSINKRRVGLLLHLITLSCE